MATGSESQCHESFREMFHCDGILLSSHTRILEKTKILTNPKNHAPLDWITAGVQFRGVTEDLQKPKKKPKKRTHLKAREPISKEGL